MAIPLYSERSRSRRAKSESELRRTARFGISYRGKWKRSSVVIISTGRRRDNRRKPSSHLRRTGLEQKSRGHRRARFARHFHLHRLFRDLLGHVRATVKSDRR